MTRIADAWEHFWFAPVPAATLAFTRIAYGLVLLGWTATMGGDLMTFYSNGTRGLVPKSLVSGTGWSVFALWSSDTAVWLAWGLLLLAAVAVVVGFRPTLALIVAFVLVTSFQHRDPFVVNSGDFVVRNLAFFLALCPSGAALSVDRWRRLGRDRFWEFPAIPQWGLRLVQLQLCLVYFFSFWNKNGGTWRSGTAVSQAWRIGDLQRVVLPHALLTNLWLSTVFSWGTLAIELALAILVWNRRCRPWVLLAAFLLHFTIDATMLVGWFSWVMLAGLTSFIPPDTSVRWIRRWRPATDAGDLSTGQVQNGLDLA